MNAKIIAILAVAILLAAGIGTVVAVTTDSSAESHEEYMRSLNIQKLGDYTYSIYYHDYDYEKGTEWLSKGNNHFETAYCTGVYKDGILGRNYDWKYSDEPSLIVRTPAITEDGKTVRHATMGVIASHILSDKQVESKKWNEKFEYLPFYTVDGMNDEGLVCQMNVVPTGDHGITKQEAEGKKDLYAMMSVRYILDYADSIEKAYELLKGRNFKAADHEIHILVAQGDRSVVFEYIDNELVMVDEQYIMTNFYLNDVKDIDYGDGEQWSDEWYGQAGLWGEEWYSKLTPYAAGMNRYDIVRDAYGGIEDAADMHDVMFSILYQMSYDKKIHPFWYDEFIGHGEYEGKEYSFTKYVKADDESFNMGIDLAIWQYEHRDELRANGGTLDVWQTIHSSVYDTGKHKMTVWTQTADMQDKQEYSFEMLSANENIVHMMVYSNAGYVTANDLDVVKNSKITVTDNILKVNGKTIVASDDKGRAFKCWVDQNGVEIKNGYTVSVDTSVKAVFDITTEKNTGIMVGMIVAAVAAVALAGAAIYGIRTPLIYILLAVAVIVAVAMALLYFGVIKL